MIFLLFIVSFLTPDPSQIQVQENIYEVGLYQPFQQIETQTKELEFWSNKLIAAPNQFAFKQQIAQVNESLFSLTANIKYLKASEKILSELSQEEIPGKASILRSLAKNYISQHRFQEALVTLEKALSNGQKRKDTKLMLIDVYEELGMENEQKKLLDEFAPVRDFNYLIRLAKWEDGHGRLDRTIDLMNEAEAIAKAGNQKARLSWIYSNLGDYYGHAGQIEQATASYKKALTINPADWYSAKGLAWIAYANQRNPKQALNILNLLDKTVSDPGIKMLKAEILEFQGSTKNAERLNQEIVKQVTASEYGAMYHHFLIHHYAASHSTINKALRLAQKEINARPVPAAYDLLAYVYYIQRDFTKARSISKNHILNQTFEPGLLLNQVYYFQNKDLPFLKDIKEEIIAAEFELGPLTFQRYKCFINS